MENIELESEIEQGYEDNRFENTVSQSFHCPICLNVLKEPVMCRRNQHYFCTSCITRHLGNSSTCPTCMEELTVETLTQASRIATDYLSELRICCDYSSRGCREVMLLNNLQRHVAICGFSPVKCSNDGCNMMVNKRDKVHHETEVCRRLKCHDCAELKKEVTEMKDHVAAQTHQIAAQTHQIAAQTDQMKKEVTEMKDQIAAQTDQIAAQTHQMEEKVMKGVARLMYEMKNLKEEVNGIKKTVQGPHLHSRGNIIIAGGEHATAYLNSVEMFSWVTKSWELLNAMKEQRSQACSVIYENQMIVTGGGTDDGTYSMEKIDVQDEAGKWKDFAAKLPVKSYAHKAVSYKDRLIVIGGYDCTDGKHISNAIYEVLLISHYCNKLLARLPKPLCRHGVVLLGEKIFIVGGETDEDFVDSVVMFDIIKKQCKLMAPLPFAISNMATVIWGNNVFVIGGMNQDKEVLNSVIMYDVTMETCKMLPPMKYCRWGCTAVITGDVLVVMGGRFDEEVECLDSVESFSLDRQVWEELPHMIKPRVYATAVAKTT